ncbi:MFS transporter [Liquorilactobacillus mali]|uniref:Na+ xyloside symporter or related transporter n=1 Tax=Liquorilactobacillus mali TaxID=1618 RepID=A0A0R2FTD5_9LACO|nr:MFS transporter [Liquorilactobacillus mali]KRN30758.1 Na+ xyloside symporter or related transporter [Liquorilactobacillus mali]MDN7145680.1 MFS transporter [Liquorilactobacillus mali]
MEKNKWQTKWPERISYGLSDGADNLVFQVMTTYLLYFYTDVYGLNSGAVAVLFIVARIADVIGSIIVGIMIDNTRSRFGKSRPFFLWYAVPYVAFAILTFATPNFSEHGKLIWAYVTYLGLGFFYTTVNSPITSVLPTMTQNPREITLLGVIRQFGGSTGQIIVSVFTVPLVALFGSGNERIGFLWTIILFGIISLILILNTFFQIRERFTVKEIAHQPLSKVVGMLKKNTPWIVLSVVILLFWLVTGIKNQTTIYYFKYVWNNADLVPWASSFTFSSLIGVILLIRLTIKHDKKKVMTLGMITALIGQFILAGGVYLSNLIIIFGGILINSIGNGIIVGLVSIMIADTIRYGVVLGIQAEGVLSSANILGVNLGLGLSGLITAGLFDVAGYVPNAKQNLATLKMINMNYVWIPLIIYILMIVVLHFYNESKLQAEINSDN